MDQTADFLTEIKKYVQFINTKIKIDKIVLFGSYAKSTASGESDIDLAIVSSDFGKSPLTEKMDLYEWRYQAQLATDIQPFPFSLVEYDGDHFFVEEIRKTGIDITDQVI